MLFRSDGGHDGVRFEQHSLVEALADADGALGRAHDETPGRLGLEQVGLAVFGDECARGVEVVGVGPLARAYGGRWVSTAAEAAEALAALVEPGDVILVKGSRSVGLEVVAAKLTGQ